MKLNNNIRQTFRVAQIELSLMFYSPVAWLVLIIFALLIGYDFSNIFVRQLHAQEMGKELFNVTSTVYNSWITGILNPILRTIYLYIPLITMGLMSREYQSGSIRLLYSSPIKNSSIIIGKYLAMMVYGAALVGVLGLNVAFSAITIENFQLPVLLVALLGIYLLILAYSAIGLFMSAMTRYQVVAAIGTLVILAIFNFIGNVGQSIDIIRDITFWLSIYGRSSAFIAGLLPSADVIYFLVVISLFISLTIFKLNTEKSIMSVKVKIVKYSAIIATALIIGYISSLPTMKLYYDATYDKSNTLSKESQDVLKNLKGSITITTYVNILAKEYHAGLPSNRNYDLKRYEKYIRFKPGIKMKYIYYYAKANNPNLDKRFPQLSDRERAIELCKINKLNFKMFKTPEEIRENIDLKAEGYNFVRIAEDKHGNKAVLRLFNDNAKHPREEEISAALKRFVSPAPTIAFSSGNGSRDIYNYGGRGFYLFAKDLQFRNSLLNQGFETTDINLNDDEISDDVSVLVLSDLKEPLSEIAFNRVENYINKGGNLIILGEYQRTENCNKLTELLGVRLSEGVLAHANKLNSPTILKTSYTKEAIAKHTIFATANRLAYAVSVPSSLSVDYSEASQKGFEAYPILETEDSTWIEYQTTDLTDGDFEYNPEDGETMGTYTTMVNLTRKINGKEQRIIVSGDSDFIANEELMISRAGMNNNNLSVISGSFRWLSFDKFPINSAKIAPIDNKINLPKASGKWVELFFVWIFPALLIFLGSRIIIRRQRK